MRVEESVFKGCYYCTHGGGDEHRAGASFDTNICKALNICMQVKDSRMLMSYTPAPGDGGVPECV